jgi:DNA-binding MarR family transcriptional regulator
LDDGGEPIHISRPAPPSATAQQLGIALAALVRYHAAVIDREDRLEAGTGTWLTEFRDDADSRSSAMRSAVLRALQLGFDDLNFRVLEELGEGDTTPDDLGERLGLDRITLAQQVSDLVSAGLATKLPETGRVSATAAGSALVDIVGEAVARGETELGDGW